MAKYFPNGTAVIQVDNSTGTIAVLIAVDTVSAVGKEVDALDVTTFSDSAERFIAGIEKSQQITLSGPFDDTVVTGPDSLFSTAIGVIQTVTINPNGTASGKRFVRAEYLYKTYHVIMGNKAPIRWEATFQRDGSATIGTN